MQRLPLLEHLVMRRRRVRDSLSDRHKQPRHHATAGVYQSSIGRRDEVSVGGVADLGWPSRWTELGAWSQQRLTSGKGCGPVWMARCTGPWTGHSWRRPAPATMMLDKRAHDRCFYCPCCCCCCRRLLQLSSRRFLRGRTAPVPSLPRTDGPWGRSVRGGSVQLQARQMHHLKTSPAE